MACQSCATSGVCHFGDRYETRCGAGRIEYLPCTVNGVGSSVLATDLPGKLVTLGHRIPRLQPARRDKRRTKAKCLNPALLPGFNLITHVTQSGRQDALVPTGTRPKLGKLTLTEFTFVTPSSATLKVCQPPLPLRFFSNRQFPRPFGFVCEMIRAMFFGESGMGSGSSRGGRPTGRFGRGSTGSFMSSLGLSVFVLKSFWAPRFRSYCTPTPATTSI